MKAALLLFTLATPAHEFYSKTCCEEHDCQPVECGEITDRAGGWDWRGMLFTKHMLQLAPDGRCHICIIKDPFRNTAQGPRCIYLPPRM